MATITCPQECEEVVLPKFTFDECNTETNSAQIAWVYIAAANAPAFTDWSDPTEWATRLGNDPTDEDKDIRFLSGIGEKPKAASNVTEISLRRRKVTGRTHTLTHRVDDTNADNHDGMRTLQCGGNVKIWYATINGLLFGGNEGIVATVDAGGVHGGGDTDIINHEYVYEWDSLLDPERTVSPL